MAILELPTVNDGSPHYEMRTQLEGVDYVFTFRFGERRGGWVFDLSTIDGDAILTGQLVTCATDWLRRVNSGTRPPGVLWALNVQPPSAANGGPFALPGLYDLGAGGRARMYYTEATTAQENADAGITSLEDL